MLSQTQIIWILLVPLAAGIAASLSVHSLPRWGRPLVPIAFAFAAAGAMWSVFGKPALALLPSQHVLFWTALGAALAAIPLTLLKPAPADAPRTARTLALLTLALALCIASFWTLTHWMVVRERWTQPQHAQWTLAWSAWGAFTTLAFTLLARRPSPERQTARRFDSASAALVASAVAGLGALVLTFDGRVADHGKVSGALSLTLLAAGVLSLILPARIALPAAGFIPFSLIITALALDAHYAGWQSAWFHLALPLAALFALAADLTPLAGWKRFIARVSLGTLPIALLAARTLANVEWDAYTGG
ncbi:MAG: hypothetical protein SFZ24_08790 [Planctomycetota bacterium]|nr:hypothetical protein [Planctomycetota bacterium]